MGSLEHGVAEALSVVSIGSVGGNAKRLADDAKWSPAAWGGSTATVLGLLSSEVGVLSIAEPVLPDMSRPVSL